MRPKLKLLTQKDSFFFEIVKEEKQKGNEKLSLVKPKQRKKRIKKSKKD